VPFQPRDPQLQLYLDGNKLTRLPGAIFDLRHLTILVLRGNELTELPSAIGKLENLETLGVSQNRLRCLPAELLQLLCGQRLVHMTLQPNPFVQAAKGGHGRPDESLTLFPGLRLPQLPPVPDPRRPLSLTAQWPCIPTINWKDYSELYASRSRGPLGKEPGYTSRFRGRSPVQYNDPSGQPSQGGFDLAGYMDPNSKLSVPTVCWLAEPPQDNDNHKPQPLGIGWPSELQLWQASPTRETISGGGPASKVPSLTELALRSASRSPYFPHLSTMLPDGSPAVDLLADACRQQESGGAACSVCSRPLFVARTQWIEWHEIGILEEGGVVDLLCGPHDSTVPFLYRGCSWRCVPQPIFGQASTTEREGY
jgi:hypothetical protein